MKRAVEFTVGAVYLLLIYVVMAFACPKGSEPYRDGVCVADIQPEYAPSSDSHWVSDERPPKDKMPSYERPGIKVIDAPNLTQQETDEMAKEKQADFVGKRAAGINFPKSDKTIREEHQIQ